MTEPKTHWHATMSIIMLIVVIGLGIFIFIRTRNAAPIQSSNKGSNQEVPAQLKREFPNVDYTKASVSLTDILSGGPGKDGIPALTNPELELITQTNIAETTRGVYIKLQGEERFYPYNILVWHEIVNDTIKGQPIAVTFCPLCGSAIVYDRTVEGEVVDFGVSGFLYESNMVMYDRTSVPSFWSQSIGRAIVGDQEGVELERLPFQLLEINTVRKKYPKTQIMTTDTGHSRDYGLYPYGNYDFNEDLLFPVSIEDQRFSAKEIFYVVPMSERSVALRIGKLKNGKTASLPAVGLSAAKSKDGEIEVRDENGRTIAGYFEMWFSWATHHQDDGTVWDPSG